MDKLSLIKEDLERSAIFSFSRSGGPGGQNVNKLNTNVLLTVPIESLKSLTEKEKNLVRERLCKRINDTDEIYVHSNEHRSQYRNRITAVIRLSALINSSIKTNKSRKKTRPTYAAVERRLSVKKRKSRIKESRNRNITYD